MEPAPRLTALASVWCLACGTPYAKPVGSGTLADNPGCPDCGDVGWATDARLSSAAPRARSGGGHRLRPRALAR